MSGRNQRNEDISDEEMDVEGAECDSDEEGGLRIDEDIYIPPPPQKIHEVDKQGGRLMITQITNINFKSYAGEVVIGPFHECFSAIVGPNGSGKSNVIDSMLFVFGYRASKIRSKKISVLIHNSSEHSNLNSCTVAVHFQKIIDKAEGSYEVVPDSECIISRTAFKDSTSFYELNGRKVQFKEIAKFLRKEGVDLDHNRFLILQGEVEQISLMKPKAQNEHDSGMLEFLEDIIGTSRYKDPLEKLMEKIELISEQVADKMNRLKIVEKEREEMKEPMEDAVGFLKIENTITKLQFKLLHCKKAECSENIAKKTETCTELEEKLKGLKDDMEKVLEGKETKTQEMREKCKKWDSIQKKKDEFDGIFDKIRKKDEAIHAELVETNKRRKSNMAEVKTENAKLEELKKIPDKNAKDILDCEKLIARHTTAQEKEEAAMKVLMEGLREKTEPLMVKRTDLETKLISHRKKVNEAKSAFDLAESELKIFTSVEKTEKEKLTKLQEAIQRTAENLQDRREQLKSLEAKIPATNKSLKTAQTELESIKQRSHEIDGKLRKARVNYEEKRSAMNSGASRNKMINALMREKREGRIPGIFGRLGDLGAIDAKYDVAISTCCGALDNIVVDKVDTAQACIKFLKDHNIGRATFIPLEKQQKFIPNCNQRINTPEDVPRLFDLIRVQDQQVRPAFYYGLRDTLVADDLNQATRIAYGARRHRVVTLRGELIETAGTMSGGGRHVIRGKMGQNVVQNEPTPAEVEELQAGLDQLFEESNELRRRQPTLEDQVHTLSVALKDMTIKRDRFQLEVKTLEAEAPSLKAQLKDQVKKVAEVVPSPGQVKKLTQAVDETKKVLEEVQKHSQSTENQVARINEEISSLSGCKVKEQQTKISNLVKAIDKAKSEICRLQVATKASARNVQKTEQRIESLEEDVKACEQKIKDGQKLKIELETDAKDVLAKIEECNEALKERDEEASSLKEEIDKFHKREMKLKAEKIDLDQKRSELEKHLAEMTHKLKDYERRIKSLKLNEIPTQAVEELTELTDEEVSRLDSRTLAANLAAAKERLPEDTPNMQIIQDFLEKDKVFTRRMADVEEVTKMKNKMRSAYDSAKKRRTDEFYAGFSVITNKLKEMYQMITLGGAAELEFVDSMDPFREGIVFSVRPPKKSWKNISNLSGGEKTLSSLALVFALHHYKPTPLYFMDEIDAALDFKNVSIVGTYIKERTKNAQFIVISLRSEMFELADTLVGIYKTYNATKTATVNIKELHKSHPKISEQEKRRKEKFTATSRTASSQVLTNKRLSSQQPMPSTCPAEINRRLSKTPEAVNIPSVSPAKTPSPVRPASRSSLRRSAPSSSDETPSKSNSLGGSQPRSTKKRKL